ncbi:MAG: outer membrane beta-barrel protein [Bacteroidales bacterium]|nr:outer membrane beta-barrel protein [Bacteroidales bacterium]
MKIPFTSKVLLTLITTVMLYSAANAQTFSGGFTLGLSGCQVDGDTQGGYHKPGIRTGFTVSAPATSPLAVESGILFSSKGAIKKSQGYTEFKTLLNYAELPIIIKYHFSPKFGAELGITYNRIISSKIIEANGAEEKNPAFLKKYDIDGLAGFRYYLSPKFELSATFGYSITKITNDPDMPYWRNNFINLSITRRFNGKNSQQ